MRGFPYHARAAEERAAREVFKKAAATFRRARTAEAERVWRDAFQAWQARTWQVVPAGLDAALTGLRRGDTGGLHLVLGFLEADPVFFRSGYRKEDALRALKRVDLTPDDVGRLHRIVLAALQRPARREFRDHCRLAAALADASPGGAGLRGKVAALAAGPDPDVARRAEWMLAAMGPWPLPR